MDAINNHCNEIMQCNQRGGRMLSVVDLVRAQTLSLELAAYLTSAIQQGASFMVGASPGGAGKTTVMGALLNFVPRNVKLLAADSIENILKGCNKEVPRGCYICHEIGAGDYYAYLWGDALKAYFNLAQWGHMMATNLHADTLDEAHLQICVENAVPIELFRKMNLILFLRVSGGWYGRREVIQVWESDGKEKHRLVFDNNKTHLNSSLLVNENQYNAHVHLMDQLLKSGAVTNQEVRRFLCEIFS